MTPIEEFFSRLIGINIWSLAKVLVLIALSLYFIFALLVVREVDLMSRTLKGVFNLPIKVVAWIHLLFALIVIILSLIIL